MKFNSRGGVSIFELFFFPAIAVSATVCSRHGFTRSSGWIFILILCLVRIISACCQLATYHSETKGLLEAVIVLESIGISPLLLATLGLLSRCAESINTNSSGIFSTLRFQLLQLFITISLILCIVGGTSSTSSTGMYQPQTETKIGIVFYLIAFFILSAIAAVTINKMSGAPSDEKWLVWAVLLALPFILVRLIYSLLSVLSRNHNFNLITGSVAVLIVMRVLEEILVVVIYLIIGWKTEILKPTSRRPIASRPWKGNLAGTSGGLRGNGRTRRQGPIHALGVAGIAVAKQHKAQRPEMSGP